MLDICQTWCFDEDPESGSEVREFVSETKKGEDLFLAPINLLNNY